MGARSLRFPILWLAAVVAILAAAGQAAQAQKPSFQVDGELALSSLITVSDAHLQKAADSFALLATSETVRSGDWSQIRAPLSLAAEQNVEGLYWFVLPDGSYWSLHEGKATGNLSDRSYFPSLMQGETVIGELVVSKATGKSSAIVAVPVTNAAGKVIGALGTSVYLDKLSERISEEMGIGKQLIFYSFDEKPLLALEWDESLIFVEPKKLSPEVSAAFDEMLSKEEGGIRYQYLGQMRTVLYRKSDVTNWWYALGYVPEGRKTSKER
jgi:hypothetical protein